MEGASDGTGLGHQFLRHVSRTRILAHLVSLGEHDEGAVASGDEESPDALRRYWALRTELEAYDPKLAQRPEIIVLTKVDLSNGSEALEMKALFERKTGRPVLVMSSVTGAGKKEAIDALWSLLSSMEEE